jgi:hypothetical protein
MGGTMLQTMPPKKLMRPKTGLPKVTQKDAYEKDNITPQRKRLFSR